MCIFLASDKQKESEIKDAIVEIWLLAHTKILYTTSGSTFGYLAGAISTGALWVVGDEPSEKWVHNLIESRSCQKAESKEPCYHDLFNPNGLSIECNTTSEVRRVC